MSGATLPPQWMLQHIELVEMVFGGQESSSDGGQILRARSRDEG